MIEGFCEFGGRVNDGECCVFGGVVVVAFGFCVIGGRVNDGERCVLGGTVVVASAFGFKFCC